MQTTPLDLSPTWPLAPFYFSLDRRARKCAKSVLNLPAEQRETLADRTRRWLGAGSNMVHRVVAMDMVYEAEEQSRLSCDIDRAEPRGPGWWRLVCERPDDSFGRWFAEGLDAALP
jgi:hypothetical protein